MLVQASQVAIIHAIVCPQTTNSFVANEIGVLALVKDFIHRGIGATSWKILCQAQKNWQVVEPTTMLNSNPFFFRRGGTCLKNRPQSPFIDYIYSHLYILARLLLSVSLVERLQ